MDQPSLQQIQMAIETLSTTLASVKFDHPDDQENAQNLLQGLAGLVGDLEK